MKGQGMLRVRTGYSFRNAVGHIDEVMARLKAISSVYAPITDRASTFAWVRWGKAAKKAGLKPVYGVELAVSPSRSEKKPAMDYWLFVARDTVEPINKLVELATEQFRYEPVLSVEQALAAASKVNVIMGHRAQLKEIAPRNGLYLGLSPATTKAQLKLAGEHPLVATSDNRYPSEGDRAFYEVLCGRNAAIQTYPQHLLSKAEWLASVEKLSLPQEALALAADNSDFILGECTAELPRAELPHVIKDPGRWIDRKCKAMAADKGINLKSGLYADRYKRELSLIKTKGYEDYFYIVADLCQWARKKMVVGPARGSSCGSLVCYLLGITTIDPIPHGLIFERFVDINRTDMPDIDIDFSDQQRYMVFDYLNDKYGTENCARLGTVAMYQPRSALNEVGTALSIPRYKCDKVADSLIERSSGDSRALHSLEDTLKTMPAGQELLSEHPEAGIAARFEGHPRHYSQHAAGVVIARDPITRYVAIDRRSGATMCDKKDAEEGFNLLKIDALGLTQLSVFEDCLEMAGLPSNHLESVPLQDEAAFEVLNKANFAGIFQFNGLALQSIVKQFHVSQFEDIVSITALARPGPLASGGAHEWVRRKNGQHAVTFPHSLFEPYLKDTLGIVLYQEQVMEIGRNIGDLGWPEVTALRKAMSKSLGKEYFDQFGDPWKRAAISKGVKPEDANKVWDDLCAYGAWSFNKSHSVAYGLISYWCCWLKAHAPFEFAAATLTHEKDPAAQIKLLREMVAEGYTYTPVDAELSTDKWTVGDKEGKRCLIGPIQNVHGIGPKMMAAVLGARKIGDRIPERAEKLLTNAVTPLDSLFPVKDAFKKALPNPAERNIFTEPTPVSKLIPEYEDKQVLVFCTLSKINPRDENEVVIVARRGFEIKDGMTTSLNLQLTDDTDTIFGKVSRFKYAEIGKPILDRGRVGKALYAIKGKLKGHRGQASTFRMIMIDAVRYIGDIDELKKQEAA